VTKEEFIKQLSELSTSELGKAGLQKKPEEKA
jgi:hypothetical protein